MAIAARDVLAWVEESTDYGFPVDAALVAGRFALSRRAAALQLERLARRGLIVAIRRDLPAWRRSYHVTIAGRGRVVWYALHCPCTRVRRHA